MGESSPEDARARRKHENHKTAKQTKRTTTQEVYCKRPQPPMDEFLLKLFIHQLWLIWLTYQIACQVHMFVFNVSLNSLSVWVPYLHPTSVGRQVFRWFAYCPSLFCIYAIICYLMTCRKYTQHIWKLSKLSKTPKHVSTQEVSQ